MRLLVMVSVAALAMAPAAGAQTLSPEISQKLDALMKPPSPEAPGCAVGIAQDGKTVLARGYGLANLETGTPNTAETIFESGSVAKQFTAAAILLLVQDGKLKLGDDIRKYLPELPNTGDIVTIEHLLNHTSGLRDWGSVANASGKPRGMRSFSNAEVVEIMSRQKHLNYKPGAEYSYTNTGYNLAAEIVARVSGKSFPDFTTERLFKPLGMTHTQWRDDFNKVIKGRAAAYERAGAVYKQSMPFMNVIGNGGILTTVGDFLIWNEALQNDSISPGLTKSMQTNGVLNDGRKIPYARGLIVQPYHGFTEVSHSGSTGGYTTWLGRYPDQKLSIALLCNTQPPGSGFLLPHQIADLFLPPATATTAAATIPADAASLAGLFVNASTGYTAQMSAPEGKLILTMAGSAPITLYGGASSKLEAGSSATVSFANPDKFTLETTDGTRFNYTRTVSAEPTAAQLAEFAGAYASSETGVTYKAAVENGQLVVRIVGWPDTSLKLTPSYKDAFMSGGTLIRFHRNSAGKITEMSWADGRMRDLRAMRK